MTGHSEGQRGHVDLPRTAQEENGGVNASGGAVADNDRQLASGRSRVGPRELKALFEDRSFHSRDSDKLSAFQKDSSTEFRDHHGSSSRRERIKKREANMSNQTGKYREDQVLVICPGSRTTMAQLGCSELSPPTHRIPTRMFVDPETEGYRPYHTYKRKKNGVKSKGADVNEEEYQYIEDHDMVDGAVYPIVAGRIVNMKAFMAFLDHVHGLLTNTYHNTPIVLMASPQWTRRDCEQIARYIFEKTKTPALCLVHSAIAAQYGLKWQTLTIVDIGFEKVDISCICDSLIVTSRHIGQPNPERAISGGEFFTRKLLGLLEHRNFTYDMAEKLKKSPICEVLPYAPDSPVKMELPTEDGAGAGQGSAVVSPVTEQQQRSSRSMIADTDDVSDDMMPEDGVLNVADIVVSGNAREFIAKRERERAERAERLKLKRGKAIIDAAEAATARQARQPNSKRKLNTFHYEALEHEDTQVPASDGVTKPSESSAGAADGASKTDDKAAIPTVTQRRTKRIHREIEVGLERFLFADRHEIDGIARMIYRAIQSIPDHHYRNVCWDNLVFVGNGSRLRGLKDNIMQTLIKRYLVSPNSASIFTSELPSNLATPTGTGSQTPTSSIPGQLPLPPIPSSSVNPLLQAATTASMGAPGATPAGVASAEAAAAAAHHPASQTPTSIKLAPLPTYLTEWSKNGFEEAMFLGSLVTARLAFCLGNLGDAGANDAQRLMSLSRVDYNELGPKAIRTHSMLAV